MDNQLRKIEAQQPLYLVDNFGVPYGNRIRVAAVKEKRLQEFKGNLRYGYHATQSTVLRDSLLDP